MQYDKEKELRRERSTLRSLALGIVAFGLWSVLKTIISLMMVPLEEILDSEALAAVTNSGLRFAVYAVMVITALAIMSVDLIPRLYVARKARREGLGEDQGRGWIICLSSGSSWTLLKSRVCLAKSKMPPKDRWTASLPWLWT